MNPCHLESANCAAIRALLSEHLDEALPSPESARVASHLDTCAACHEEFQALHCVAELAAFVAVPPVSSALKYRILNSVARQEFARRNSPLRKVVRALRSRAEVTAAIAFGIVVAVIWSQRARVINRAPGSNPSQFAGALLSPQARETNNSPRGGEARLATRRNASASRSGVSSPIHESFPILWATTKDAVAEDKSVATRAARSPVASETTPDEARPQPDPAEDTPTMVADMPVSMMMSAAMEEAAPPDPRDTTREMGAAEPASPSDPPGDVIALTAD